jgi:hypothetical protein
MADTEAAAQQAADLSSIVPEPGKPFPLRSGFMVQVMPLDVRQLFRVLRIITHGSAPMLATGAFTLDFRSGKEDFAQNLLMLLMFSIPDAENEAIAAVQSLVEPAGLMRPGAAPKDVSDKEREHNQELYQRLAQELFRPHPEDVLTIVEQFIAGQAGDIQSLGKRLQRFLALAAKTGQLKQGKPEPPPAPEELSQAVSRARSTSSVPSTDGTTSASSASPSGGSNGSSTRLADVFGKPS